MNTRNKTMMLRIFTFAVLTTLISLPAHASNVKPTITFDNSFDHSPALVWDKTTIGVDADTTPPTPKDGETIIEGPDYSWSIVNVKYSTDANGPYAIDTKRDHTVAIESPNSASTPVDLTTKIKGYWEITVKVSVKYEDSGGNIYKSTSDNTVSPKLKTSLLELKTVAFGGAAIQVIQDNGNPYKSPQWVDNSTPLDGDAVDQGDHDFPVCYVRKSAFTLKPVWDADASGTSQGIQVKGSDGNNLGISFPATSATLNNGTVTVAQAIGSNGVFPNKIEDYEPLKISWSYSVDGGKSWHPGGTNANRVYIVLSKPVGNVTPYETVLDISCRSGSGQDTVAKAVPKIWSAFTGPPHKIPAQGVKRKAIDGYNKNDGMEMTYWKPVKATCQTLAKMLIAVDGDGSCIAWSQLFQATLQVEGITQTHILEITADTTINPHADGFLVKNWKFGKHIRTGQNGICDSKPMGDDVVIVKFGNGYPNQTCITAGTDGKLDTTKIGGDDVLTGNTISTGPDGVCNTVAAVGDVQVIPKGQGASDMPCIMPGKDGVLVSTTGGDDTVQDGVFKGTHYPYILDSDANNNPVIFSDARDQAGVAGQANDNPPGYFYNHFVVEYNDDVYDPSYGNGPYGKGNLTDNELAHEQTSIAGIKALIPGTNEYMAKKKKQNVNELDYKVIN